MKDLIKAYTTFSPKLYNILVVLAGTPILALLGLYVGFVSESLMITMIILLCALILVDVYGDFFVFQGIFSKQYEFGILRNSVKGEKIIKLALVGDMIKRLLMYFVVLFCASIPYRGYMIENGLAANGLEQILLILDMAILGYFAITSGFMITRMVYNFYDGLLAMIFSSLISGTLITFGVMAMFSEGFNVYIWFITLVILALGISFIMIERTLKKFRLSFGDKEMGRFGDDSKKKMWIFIAVAFGIDYLMIPAMYFGLQKGLDLSTFVAAMMMYPACGVALGKLFSYNEGKLPVAAYVTVIVATVLGIICSIMSITMPQALPETAGGMDLWFFIYNFVLIIGSVLLIVFASSCGKEKKENGGLKFSKPGLSILLIFVYIVLFFGRALILNIIGGIAEGDIMEGLEGFAGYFTNPNALPIVGSILLNVPLTIIMFFGEEYGWRYYLQPIMQKKFGITAGTLLLGVVWAVWHIGADFMYYTTESGPQMLVTQCITCISLAIFLGYVYLKTKNIWAVAIMHLLNNNLVMFLAGDASIDVLQGNEVQWSYIPFMAIGAIVWWAWIFTPTMLGKKVKLEENVAAQNPSASEEA
ncbi:MAG: CPBP family intramembrane metalloprotease [Lachnospiraceae bacterium]|nr:CPBP family intramembrane metalloprotease [Lachnospiraceae bacterium]